MNSLKGLAEDLSRLRNDPLGYVYYAFPWGKRGTPLAQSEGPRGWQREYLRTLGEMMGQRNFDGVNPVAPIQIATASGHGIGKSALTAWLIKFILDTRPYAKGVVTANTASQLSTKTWAELQKWNSLSVTGSLFQYTNGQKMSLCCKESPETWRCDGLTCRKENAESFAGLHAANSTPFYIFDEASAIPEEVWEVAKGGLTDGEPVFCVFGNPTRNTGSFRECFGRNAHRWVTKQIDSRTVEGTNREYFDQLVSDNGEDSDVVRVRVKGEFPLQGSSQLIPSDAVYNALGRHLDRSEYSFSPVILGVDVARFGDDRSVIFRRQGLASWLEGSWRGMDTMLLSNRVAGLIVRLKPDAVFVDEGGVGGGVVDRLRQLGHKVIGVNFGTKATNPMYANKRSEMWCLMRDWLVGEDGEGCGALPDDNELRDDLIGPEYGHDKLGRIMLEQKEDMKKRGLSSPDVADALALTFASPIGKRHFGDDRFRGSRSRVYTTAGWRPF